MSRMLGIKLSRREFVAAAAGSLVMARPSAARQLTAGAIVERIRANVGMAWRENTVDGLKAGDPATVVTGIAVTVMATLDVLRKAAAANKNFVVTQEPVFYAPNDNPGARETDPVYLAKRAFIEKERLVIFRFADHWNASRPQAAPMALANALGWGKERATENDRLYSVPPTTLGGLAADVRARLNIRGGVRVVGRPDLPIRNAYVSPGTTDVPGILTHLPRADVVIAGEPREWEAVPYVADSVTAGQAKGMIALGRLVSEEPGALVAAVWLKSVMPELTIDSFRLIDPYWSPRS
jgi:putative NIF3 family GTP cyclohydrolase 1 type 2